ncbi:MAG TPA: Ig-like domain-containing protein [Myxococcota bacterium]|nr:Ig-like domain-containing protein [Myxococcota bacterium]
MRARTLTSLLLVAACSSDLPTEGSASDKPAEVVDDGATEPAASEACAVSVVSLDPADGAHDMPARATVTAWFNAPLTGAEPWSITVAGASGDVRLSEDGMRATWTPSQDLQLQTEYQITASVCGVTVEQTFRTEPPPFDEQDLLGSRWTVSPRQIRWVGPLNLDTVIALLGLREVALEVEADPAGGLELRAEIIPEVAGPRPNDRGDEGDDAEDRETFRIGHLNTSENPRIDTGPDDVDVTWEDTSLTVRDVHVYGVVEDGVLRDVGFSAWLDLRDLSDSSERSLCDLNSTICSPCADGANTCVTLAGAFACGLTPDDPP